MREINISRPVSQDFVKKRKPSASESMHHYVARVAEDNNTGFKMKPLNNI
uniref:Uncharacterized protein n=1 Tax=Anguilla anguilla TaxID=7936 RepID=A0A0E9WVP9_ANGAN